MKRVPHSTHSLQYFFFFCRFFDNGHSDQFEVIPLCTDSFDLNFFCFYCSTPKYNMCFAPYWFQDFSVCLWHASVFTFFPFSFHLYVPQGGLYLFILPEFDDFFHLWINIFNQVWKIFGNYLLRYFVFCLIFSLYSYMLLAYIYNSLSLVHTICKLWLTFFILSSFFTSD